MHTPVPLARRQGPRKRVRWDMAAREHVGVLLRSWRQRHRRTQLELALDAEISQRHLSFLESGRASPSREMLLRLADRLDIPLRDRNGLLIAAGFAPVFAERPIDHAAMANARSIVDSILRAHEPNPALVVDRHWNLVIANNVVKALLAGVADSSLLETPVNVLRLTLHPGGLAPQIVNLPEWRAHILERLRRQIEASADSELTALLAELAGYGSIPNETGETASVYGRAAPTGDPSDVARYAVAVPLELSTSVGRLSLISTTTVFGTATEIILSELVIESFYPADEATAERLVKLQNSAT